MVMSLHNSVRNIGVAILFVSVIFGQWVPVVVGGPYVLEWTTIDGGGGVSSGGTYTLTGTIGQYDAAYSAGADYEVLGGFWPGGLGPSGVLCVVDFEDYARFAQYWLETGDDLPADLYKDEYNIVDFLDLNAFVEEWLFHCPADWPLQ
jgi:hypothetical protein